MRIKINELRKVIRTLIIETYESEEDVYDDTVLPGDSAEDELLAEPDLTDQRERDEYLRDKAMSRKKKSKLRSSACPGEEPMTASHAMGDESNAIGGGGIAGHMGGAWGPPQPSRPLKPKNAMGKKRKQRK